MITEQEQPQVEEDRGISLGVSLLSRDTPENRAKWGEEGVGYEPIAASVCADADDGDDKKCPYYNYQHDATHENALSTPIHLLIASFRDVLCPRTLHNAFTHAENPHRIYIRIIDQHEPDSDLPDDAGCWDRYCTDYNTNCSEFKDNVKSVVRDAATAQGPTDARSKLSAMIYWDYLHGNDPAMLDFHKVEPDDFCMETDSHMDFSDNFDTGLIAMHHRTKNDFAVLSTYVASMEQNNQDPPYVPNLCMVEFTSTIRNWGTKECRNLKTPKLTNAMWGAGLSFHRCHAEINVPVDPYLDGVFDGEEGSRGLRFFTHGYDVYTPDHVLVTHDYHGHQSNPHVHTWHRHDRSNEEVPSWPWLQAIENAQSKVRTKGTKRVNMLLGIGKEEYSEEDLKEIEQIRASRFGLGTKRSLEQAGEFSGINLRERKMVKNKCGNLIWVPFDPHPVSDAYGIQQTLKRGLLGAQNSNSAGDSAANAMLPPISPEIVLNNMVQRRDTTLLRGNGTDGAHFDFHGAAKVAGIIVLVFVGLERIFFRLRRKKGDRYEN